MTFKTACVGKHIRAFLLPPLTRRFAIRASIIAIAATGFFSTICLPMKIRGASMMPTYPEHGFTFCWRPAFWFKSPRHGDVVILRYTGRQTALLKRIVGLPGDTIAFESGNLIRNGHVIVEPYTSNVCDWQLEPRVVSQNHIYVVGDNRTVDIDTHMFGEIDEKRLLGTPLW